MQPRLLQGTFFLLLIASLLFSCRKEYSCESCIPHNQAPIANAGKDQIIQLPGDSALLDGTLSTDADGMINRWQWTKIAGPALFDITDKKAAKTIVKSLSAGIYQFELKVTDDQGAWAVDTMIINVQSASYTNQPPIANAGKDQILQLPRDSALLDGTLSSDADGNIMSWQWAKIAGPALFNITDNKVAKTIAKGLTAGIYQFELKVTDDQGAWAVDTMMINVQSASYTNQSPIANAGRDTTIVLPVNITNLDGRLSSDPDNNIVDYTWTKIAGPSSSSIANVNFVQTTVTDLVEGVYLFELKVTDAGGLFDLDTIQATVMKRIQPPVCTSCKVVFVSDRDGNPEIYTCNADGSNITRLTYDAASDDEPSWSPDHTQIAFVSDRTGNPEIYTVNADGSNLVRRTFSQSYSHSPSWSPDGIKITYSTLSNGSVNIWVMNAAGGSPSILLQQPGFEDQPSWSPDGTKIVLYSDWEAFDIVYDIFTINSDGSNFKAITGNINDAIDYLHPSWSPDGTKIALVIRKTIGIDQYDTQLGVMNPDGSALTAIISNAQLWTKTSWSPDGTKIIYTSLTGPRQDISWISVNGSASGTIVTNGWNADW